MASIESLITTCISLGCAETLKALGVSAGELTERQAKKTYGRWFIEAIQREFIRPCRVGNGAHGTKWYSVTDILKYKASREAKAQIKF